MASYFRNTEPRNLTSWLMYQNGAPDAGGLNIGTEFAGYDAPKFKFLFTLSFQLGDTLRLGSATSPGVNAGSDQMSDIVYACKSATRPNPSINYVEVNSYNYRRKVATRTDFGTVTVTFYDDNKNTAHDFLSNYLQAISPVTNKTRDNYNVPEDIQGWASMGPLPTNEADGLIRSLRVTQHFNPTYTDGDDSASMVHYDYINPKIQQFNWDDLDMSVSDVSMLSITFVFDSVTITKVNGFNDILATNLGTNVNQGLA